MGGSLRARARRPSCGRAICTRSTSRKPVNHCLCTERSPYRGRVGAHRLRIRGVRIQTSRSGVICDAHRVSFAPLPLAKISVASTRKINGNAIIRSGGLETVARCPTPANFVEMCPYLGMGSRSARPRASTAKSTEYFSFHHPEHWAAELKFLATKLQKYPLLPAPWSPPAPCPTLSNSGGRPPEAPALGGKSFPPNPLEGAFGPRGWGSGWGQGPHSWQADAWGQGPRSYVT